ncbi:extracellular solute-binding protein [Paenibacillus chungangensis]|uniref:Extracellular solute-binding protein n=1 Tax=Paenibacillus chungangensis TaxID=696535 RepID=A0ABW3HUJ3_9BACL
MNLFRQKREPMKLVILFGVLLSLIAIISGCGDRNQPGNNHSDATNQQESESGQQSAKPFQMSIMLSPAGEAPKNDSEVKSALEQLTDTKLAITFVPRPAYADKFNVTLASGDMPKALLALDPKNANVVNSIQSGVFWEIGPYLKDYPNLSKLDPQALENSKFNGKIYGLIRSRGLGLHGISFRKDWLDNVGLDEPKTIDELYEVLKAFTLNDPDQNGKHDTYGLVESKDLISFEDVSIFFGAPKGWGIQDGKMVPAFATKEYMDTLLFFKKLYDEKLMNTNFALLNSQQKKEEIKKGKAGLFVGPLNLMTAEFVSGTVQKEAVYDAVNAVDGPFGMRAISTPGFYGMYLFPKSSNKTEEDLRQALQFFDKISGQEGMDLLHYGIRDDYYKVVDDRVVMNPEKSKIAQIESQFNHLAISPKSVATPLAMSPLEEKVKRLEDANQSIAVADKAYNLLSKTFTEKGAELTQIVNDASIKFIMGQIDNKDWDNMIAEWKEMGGNQVIQEYTEQLEANR